MLLPNRIANLSASIIMRMPFEGPSLLQVPRLLRPPLQTTNLQALGALAEVAGALLGLCYLTMLAEVAGLCVASTPMTVV